MAKIEFDDQIIQAEKALFDFQEQFRMKLNKQITEANNEREQNFALLRPNYGHPTKQNHLQTIDNREKIRQDDTKKVIDRLRTTASVNTCIVNSIFKKNIVFLGGFTNKCANNHCFISKEWRTFINLF